MCRSDAPAAFPAVRRLQPQSLANHAVLAAGLLVFCLIAGTQLPPLHETTSVLSKAAAGAAGSVRSQLASSGLVRGAAAQEQEEVCGAKGYRTLSAREDDIAMDAVSAPVAAGPPDSYSETPQETQMYEDLFQWVANVSGYEPLMKVGKVCRDEGTGRFCMRGTYATQPIKPEQIIARLPPSHYIVLPEVTPEAWLSAIHEFPAFNQTFGVYLKTLPKRGEIFAPEGMSDNEIRMLQGGALEARFRAQYDGLRYRYQQAMGSNGSDLVRRLGISLADYAHAGMGINTRYWMFKNETNGSDTNKMIATMVPLLDMADHAEEPTAIVTKDANDSVVLIAKAHIDKGEEVAIAYQQYRLHRPDMALMNYGYLPKHRPPLLAAFDLGNPEAIKMRDDGGTIYSAANDDEYKLGGRMATHGELKRLLDLLASFPTTEAQDRAIMAEHPELITWREKMLLEFRAERKAALRFVAARLADGFVEWQRLTYRQKLKWANYSDFEDAGSDANPPTPTGEESDVAKMLAAIKPQTGRSKLRLDWEAALAVLAAVNTSDVVS